MTKNLLLLIATLCSFFAYSQFTVNVSASNSSICIGENTTLSASDNFAATSYVWSPASGLSSATGTSVVANPVTTTTYTVTALSTHGHATKTITITVNALPTVSVTGNSEICNGASTTLTASGASTYSWSPTTGLSGTTGTSVTANRTSNQTYTVTGTNANGCVNSTTHSITVNAFPTVSVAGNSEICLGSSTSFTASGADTYIWSPATGLSGTTGSTVTANPTSDQTYVVTGTDANGCVNSTTHSITINALPTISVSGNSNICEGSSTSFTASGATIYSWSPATNLSGTTGSTITATPTSTTTYTVTGIDFHGCSNTTNHTINVFAKPTTTSFTGPNEVLLDSKASYTVTSPIATSTYQWTYTHFDQTPVEANGTLLDVTFNNGKSTEISLQETNVNGCKSTPVKMTVTINQVVSTSSINEKNTAIIGSYDLQGRSISPTTTGQFIILMYSDGSTQKVWNK